MPREGSGTRDHEISGETERGSTPKKQPKDKCKQVTRLTASPLLPCEPAGPSGPGAPYVQRKKKKYPKSLSTSHSLPKSIQQRGWTTIARTQAEKVSVT